jgi:hypothetical protein
LYFVQLGDKKVVGVFVRFFRAPLDIILTSDLRKYSVKIRKILTTKKPFFIS